MRFGFEAVFANGSEDMSMPDTGFGDPGTKPPADSGTRGPGDAVRGFVA